MTCTFCGTENSVDGLTPDQARDTLRVILQRGFSNVVLGGGEPFVWKHDVVALAREAKGMGLFVQIGTNGIDLPHGFEALACVDRFVLPLDGYDAESHNAVRIARDGHFQLILNRLEALRSAGKSVTVSTVVTSRNIGALNRIARQLAEYAERGGQLHAWHLYKFLPIGRGGREYADELAISDAEFIDACTSVKAAHPALTIYRRNDMRFSRHVDFFWYEGGKPQIGSEVWGQGTVL
ncbi:MAG: hypothetical protein AMXMBFR82_38350 [Candidatus Hydrogenedentota bacterium]